MRSYLELLREVMQHGEIHSSRAGATRRLWGRTLHVPITHTFPVLTTRRIPYMPILGELAAFLEGTCSVKRFEALGCNYWGPNAEAWKPGEGSVGRIYGAQWRNWDGYYDQLVHMVDNMRDDPHSRRHLLTAWNPTELNQMCLPPCHVLSQYSVRNDFLDAAVYMRSVDVCLGLPADMVLYAALTGLLAQSIGRRPGTLVFFMADCHVYENHTEQAYKQLEVKPTFQPTWHVDGKATIANFRPEHIIMEYYQPTDQKFHYQLNV